jgi:hypothetical protein
VGYQQQDMQKPFAFAMSSYAIFCYLGGCILMARPCLYMVPVIGDLALHTCLGYMSSSHASLVVLLRLLQIAMVRGKCILVHPLRA